MPREVYTLEDLRRWKEATAEEARPVRLAVLGDPVAHSASPPMHNAALAACGIPARYTRLHILPAELPEALRLLPSRGFLGVNLTIPHKEMALDCMDQIDEHARRIGVVNTVQIEGEALTGFNTDGPGLVRAIRAALGAELGNLRVLLLGAGGGAGRAVARQCVMEGCRRLALVNRTFAKAAGLAGELRGLSPKERLAEILSAPWEEAALEAELALTDLVINCSSVGMKAGDPPALSSALLSEHLLVFDTIYTAARTPLMLAADGAGARSANGLSMLLHQGALAFEIWFGRPAPLEAMQAALLAAAPK